MDDVGMMTWSVIIFVIIVIVAVIAEKYFKYKKAFIICPVRNASHEVNNKIDAFIRIQSFKRRIKFYWPLRDTKQDGDPIGIRICQDNRKALWEADEVYLWYDKDSIGSVYDLGMFFGFLMHKPYKFFIINPEDVKPTPEKSFANVILALAITQAPK